MSSLDKDAIELIEQASQSDLYQLISPLVMPNVFAWYAMVSKIRPEPRAKWPKAKAAKPQQNDTK